MKLACNPDPTGFTHLDPEYSESVGMTTSEFHHACRQAGMTPVKNKNLVI